jgi:hypothetical protein
MAVDVFADPQGNALQSEVEAASADSLGWFDVAQFPQRQTMPSRPAIVISASGDHYLRLAADVFDPEVVTRQYSCGVFVFGP